MLWINASIFHQFGVVELRSTYCWSSLTYSANFRKQFLAHLWGACPALYPLDPPVWPPLSHKLAAPTEKLCASQFPIPHFEKSAATPLGIVVQWMAALWFRNRNNHVGLMSKWPRHGDLGILLRKHFEIKDCLMRFPGSVPVKKSAQTL